MLNLKQLTIICFFFFGINLTYSQLGFSHEIGVIAGPVEFRSDFGSRSDLETNFGNSGIGIGIVHYINFAYIADCDCYSTDIFFNDHFKLRSEISWNKTKLEHFGEWVGSERTSIEADQLRAHKGIAENFDVGMQLEFFPKSLRSFQGFGYKFAPFFSLGVHFTSINPKASTDYGNGDVLDSSNIYSFWYENPQFLPSIPSGQQREYPINTQARSSWSMVTSIGVRYKLSVVSDLMLDFRYQLYFNDWVDGLNHQLSFNKSNDWLLWLNFGYIYYLD